MSHSLMVPSSAKIRLCSSAKTADFGRLLEHAGASWVTLHARHVSTKRRRQGAADLDAIRELKQALTIPVVSNGNVRTFSDVLDNVAYTRADGVMVGETLLGNPCLFSGENVRDPVHMALEYLEICKHLEGVATLKTMRAHVRYIIEFQWCARITARRNHDNKIVINSSARRPWYPKFRLTLNGCQSVDDIEVLLCRQVSRWRGKAGTVVLAKSEENGEGSYLELDNLGSVSSIDGRG